MREPAKKLEDLVVWQKAQQFALAGSRLPRLFSRSETNHLFFLFRCAAATNFSQRLERFRQSELARKFCIHNRTTLYQNIKRYYFVPSLVIIFFTTLGFSLQNVGLLLPVKFLNAPENRFNIIDGDAQWLNVSYFQEGLIRRGFAGSSLQVFPENLRYIIYVMLTVVIIASLYAFFVYYSFRRHPSITKKIIFYIFCFSPLGAMNFGWMFGRFEFLNYILLIACLFLAERNKLHLVALLSCVALLIHEAYLFYGLPMTIAFFCVKKINLRTIIKTFIIPILLSVYLAVYGNSEVNALGSKRGIFEIYNFAWIDIFILSIYAVSIVMLHKMVYSSVNAKPDVLFAAPYATFLLFLFGVDIYRWHTILLTMVVISATIKLSCAANLQNPQVLQKNKLFLASALILSFPFFGPAGVVTRFPAFQNFLTLLEKL